MLSLLSIFDADLARAAVFSVSGGFTLLAVPTGCDVSHAFSGNASGIVTGTLDVDPTTAFNVQPHIWTDANTYVNITPDDYALGAAWDVNGDGKVTGTTFRKSDSKARAFYYDGLNTAIFDPPTGYTETLARAINSSKTIGGQLIKDTSDSPPVLWTYNTSTNLHEDPVVLSGWPTGRTGIVVDINDSGTVLGWIDPKTDGTEAGRPFLWTATNGVRYLGEPGQLGFARRLSDDNVTVGFNLVGSDQFAWVWVGSPNPSQAGAAVDFLAFCEPGTANPELLTCLNDSENFGGSGAGTLKVFVASPSTTYTRVAPGAYTVVTGLLSSGNVGSLGKPDADLFRVSKTGSSDTDPVVYETTATLPTGITTLSALVFRQTARLNVAGGYEQKLELFDYDANAWSTVDVRTDPTQTLLRNRDLTASGDLWRYVRSSDRQMRARVTVTPTGIGAASSWAIEVDQGAWLVKP